MTFPPFAKAIAGALVGALAPVGTAATTAQGITPTTGYAAVIAAVAGAVLTYCVPNGPKAGATVGGLVVTVKTDVGKFLAAFATGLPALVQSSAEAAIASAAPAPIEPTPAAPPVEPAPDPAVVPAAPPTPVV